MSEEVNWQALALLRNAAYFAHYAMFYPMIKPSRGVPKESFIFLSPELLWEHCEYPFVD
jgi:hypothetical protein